MSNYPPGTSSDPRAPWNQQGHDPSCPVHEDAPEWIPNPDDLLDAANEVLGSWTWLLQHSGADGFMRANDLVNRSALVRLERIAKPQCACEEKEDRDDRDNPEDYDDRDDRRMDR